jgi:hypothetical protein
LALPPLLVLVLEPVWQLVLARQLVLAPVLVLRPEWLVQVVVPSELPAPRLVKLVEPG